MGTKCRFYMDVQTLNSGVTGSCHLCIVKYPDGTTTRFIVDCGLFQGKDEENNENKTLPFNEDQIEFALITHNHIDHTGRIPLLVKNGFKGNIYMTEPTSILLPLALYDSCSTLKSVAKRAHTNALYTEKDVEVALKYVQAVTYNESIWVNDRIKVTFFCNGHLVGAAMILVEITYPGEAPINWFFTGDYNNKNVFFDVPNLPQNVLEMPLNIMQEATYGYMNASEIVPCFKDNLLQAVSESSTIVVPVFSLGRSQEILYFLRLMQDNEFLDVNIPIFFDGNLAQRYTRYYLKNIIGIKPEMVDFLPHNLTYVDADSRDSVLSDNNCKIIVTTSGMGSYGPALIYIAKFIKQQNALIHFTGYTAEDTMGGKLKLAEQGDIVSVGGLRAKKLARVEYTSEFSAHAKADEMIAFLNQFKKLHAVIVNHGGTVSKELFAARIIDEVDSVNEVGVASREMFFRVSAYHLIKTLSTKFS